jgi:hypothetical protein
MSQENVFLFYNYAEVVNETLKVALQFFENNNIEPEVVSKLQLKTVSLEDVLNEDFNIIKFILSEINNYFALWLNSGTYEYFLIFIIVIVLNILLEILSLNYTTLASQSGIDFNQDEVSFILVGQVLNNTKNNALRLVKKSSISNSVVEDKEKIVESVLGFNELSSKFSKELILNTVSNILNV